MDGKRNYIYLFYERVATDSDRSSLPDTKYYKCWHGPIVSAGMQLASYAIWSPYCDCLTGNIWSGCESSLEVLENCFGFLWDPIHVWKASIGKYLLLSLFIIGYLVDFCIVSPNLRLFSPNGLSCVISPSIRSSRRARYIFIYLIDDVTRICHWLRIFRRAYHWLLRGSRWSQRWKYRWCCSGYADSLRSPRQGLSNHVAFWLYQHLLTHPRLSVLS